MITCFSCVRPGQLKVPRLLGNFVRSFLFSLAVCALACSPMVDSADLVLRNGKIVTLDSENPLTEALAVTGDRIVWTGSTREAEPYVGPATRVIDLNEMLAIPGFIEGHAHFSGIGEAKLELDLTETSSWDEIVEVVRKVAEERVCGEWILGRGWHQEKWQNTPKPTINGFPLHDELSRVSPCNPVLLTHASGHAVFANAKAMELAGIDSRTSEPPGGEIVTDLQDHPTGVFRETAANLFGQVLSQVEKGQTPAEQEARLRKIVQLAAQECVSKGITTLHDAGVSFGFARFIKELVLTGEMPLRLYLMLNEPNSELAEAISDYRWLNLGNHKLTVRSIKRFVDGALGAHGAWLFEPYEDLKSSCGLNTTPLDSLEKTAELAVKNGFQLCVHAIGDRANREVLDLFERTYRKYADKSDLRWRIEHAQHLSPEDIPRFSRLGVIASMQPIHATSDGPWVVRRLGEFRAKEGAYVWRKLLDVGAVIVGGTDAPVEDVDPIGNFYAAVSRRMKDGTVFYANQCMSREEALRCLTLGAAFAGFEETEKGSLTPGKLADITILSRDIMSIPVEEIPETRVVYTIVGGEIVWPTRE